MEEDKVYFIGHQSNLLVLQSVVSGVGISPTQHLYNIDRFGNCGAAQAHR
ncbi:3-oxoacyl-[acyl-carrier-protein] synthase III C-terminal domain-containing protein [Candidatus Coxiella mudrowiae]|nr:3-oxoacyl-[acyl-carrier-protein] synthase III C-terminal domain-containing protein [Candidatus Coxiella mudrowiae]